MKKIFVLSVIVSLLLTTGTGCIKEKDVCQQKTVESEEAAMVNYAASISIPAIKHSSGMYYYIENQGNATMPTLNSNLKANYIGKLLNGTVFDQTTTTTGPATFALGGVIFGWQLGLPLIGEGGIIHLFIPSSLAYGCSDNGPIPAYSVLYFRVELVDVL